MFTTRQVQTQLGLAQVEDQVVGSNFETMIVKKDLKAAEALQANLQIKENSFTNN